MREYAVGPQRVRVVTVGFALSQEAESIVSNVDSHGVAADLLSVFPPAD